MRFCILFFVAGVSCMGCGTGSPFDYVPVSGTVKYEDGTPIPADGVQLRFDAQDAPTVENAFPRPGLARLNAQGEFDSVTSYKYGDGLIPGRHKVAIEAGAGPGGQSIVPKEYTSIATTPLIISTDDAPLEIKVPKPAAGPAR